MGFINKKGEVVIDPEYDFVGPFINGYSVVENNDEGYREIGVIDNTGEEIIEISDKYQSIYYSDKKDEFRFWKEDEIGFIDIKGDEFIEIDGALSLIIHR